MSKVNSRLKSAPGKARTVVLVGFLADELTVTCAGKERDEADLAVRHPRPRRAAVSTRFL
jgi:hypothetical protein